MIYEFKFPDIGEGIHEGKVLQLKLKPGDEIEAGDTLAVVETDKVVAEIPSPKNGILEKYGIEEGQIINVGDPLAFIHIRDNEQTPAEEEPVQGSATVVGQLEESGSMVMPASGEGISDFAPESASLVEGRKKSVATPLARKLARDHGIDLTQVQGSGPAGRIMKKDILEISPRPRSVQEKSLPTEEKPSFQDIIRLQAGETKTVSLSTLRKTLAENLEKSQSIPVAVIQDFTVVNELVALRDSVNQNIEEKIGYQPFFMKALSQAMKRFPEMNSTYHEESRSYTIHGSVNVGFAMDAPEGLIVPVVQNVQDKSILQIDREMKALIKKARERKIGIEDFKGGTITITNYGPFAGIYGRPMILPPQVGILGFGRIHQAPIVENSEIVSAWILPISVAFDHRVIDGVPGSNFIRYFFRLLKNPQELLITLR